MKAQRIFSRARPYRVLHPQQWPNWIICKVGDGPLILLTPHWRDRLRGHWKICLVNTVDSWVAVPWILFQLHLRRPPERRMTEQERKRAERAIYFKGLRRNDPKYLRLLERWEALWAREQSAAHARAEQRGVDRAKLGRSS